MYTPVTIYYDIASQSLIESDGGTNPTVPAIYLHNYYYLDIQLYDTYPAEYDISAATTFKIGLGTPGTVYDPLVEVTNANVDSTSKATGYIIGSADIGSAEIIADMGTIQTKLYAIELKADNDTTVAQFPCYVKNTVYHD